MVVLLVCCTVDILVFSLLLAREVSLHLSCSGITAHLPKVTFSFRKSTPAGSFLRCCSAGILDTILTSGPLNVIYPDYPKWSASSPSTPETHWEAYSNFSLSGYLQIPSCCALTWAFSSFLKPGVQRTLSIWSLLSLWSRGISCIIFFENFLAPVFSLWYLYYLDLELILSFLYPPLSGRFLQLYRLLLKTAEGGQQAVLFVTFSRQLLIVLSFTKR